MHNKDLAELARASIQPSFPTTKFRVFVFGPYLKPDDVVIMPTSPVSKDNHESVIEHARYLRFLTKQKLEKEGFPVDYGETREVLDFWETDFKTSDLGSMELLHADRIWGAIIMFPSSIGSICELGMFSASDEIPEKTLAIIHSEYSEDSSFFRLGMLKVFKQEKGSVEFINYSKYDDCIDKVVDFVKGEYQKLLREHKKIKNARLKEKKYDGTLLQIPG